MGLDDTFKEIISKRESRRHLVGCAYQTLYNSLNEDDRKALDDAWAKHYPVNLIVQALRSNGLKASSDTIRAHQNGTCRCPKE